MAEGEREAQRNRRETTKIVLVVILAVVLVAFVVANTDSVNVSFLVADFDVPLIFVLIVTAIMGAVIDRLFQARRRRLR
jgi:uncharacterized integral membrane protein